MEKLVDEAYEGDCIVFACKLLAYYTLHASLRFASFWTWRPSEGVDRAGRTRWVRRRSELRSRSLSVLKLIRLSSHLARRCYLRTHKLQQQLFRGQRGNLQGLHQRQCTFHRQIFPMTLIEPRTRTFEIYSAVDFVRACTAWQVSLRPALLPLYLFISLCS